ncbi:hypothetical protein [Lysobacter sp. F6437]|uniref:hypothetical protein n=1 Tax=Lysobacter sp. F6437 TaxID=3459296 RepID=UPI00403D99AC
MKRSRLAMVGKCFLLVLTLASCAYFARGLLAFPDLLLPTLSELEPFWFALSLLAGMLHVFLLGWILALLLDKPNVADTAAVFLASQAVKYIPGRVWGVAAQKALLGGEATLGEVVGANVVLTGIIAGGHVMGAAVAWGWIKFGGWFLPVVVAGCVVAACAAIACFKIMAGFCSWQWISVWQRPGIWRLVVVGCLLASASAAIAWLLLLRGALGYEWGQALSLYISTSLSVIAGFFSLLPAGLGTREAALVWLDGITSSAAPSEIAAYAVVSRVWLLGVDVVCAAAGIAWLVQRRRYKSTLRNR